MKIFTIFLAFLLFLCTSAYSQIIDVHMHCYTEEDYYGGTPHPYGGIESPANAEDHLQETLQYMDKHDIEFAVISGSMESVEKWAKADPRFIPGFADEKKLPDIEKFEEMVKNGKIKVFGEIMAVYLGRTLNDPIYEPYLAICEEYGIPVAYHTGGGPPMTPYMKCCPDFRISLGDPLLIEDVLVKYPDLKLYLMHAGEVFFEHGVRMMSLYRHLYVDIAVLLWVDPIVQDYAVRFLKLARQAGVLDRVMYGSDQMVWPGAITRSIEFLDSMDFLTEEEKRMILYDNAKRFLEIESSADLIGE
ncbi:MAG: amidohydrolase family protein [candidate division Zixibacteria bacterium]|nr:amidohydrolase family protein [candidate division Zixibacteria bacterium]